jgi:hypothetical protein
VSAIDLSELARRLSRSLVPQLGAAIDAWLEVRLEPKNPAH